MLRFCVYGLLLGLISAQWACSGIIDVGSDAAVGADATAPDCHDPDGDRYGNGVDCLGPDCNQTDSQCWEGSCCDEVDCVDPDDDGYGEGADCLGPDCDETDTQCWEGSCCDEVDCVDPDDDGYGEGADCLGPDCNETDSQCWQPGDSCCQVGPYGTCGTGGPIGECLQVSLPSGDYFVYAPPIDPENPLPMVMALHGDEGSPLVAIRYFWEPVWSSSQDFILVMPKCPAANGSWWDSDTHAHVGFIDDVIDDVAGKYNVDIDRVYAIGYSGGSVWLGWHGFQFQDVFAGIQWCCGGSNAWYTAPPRDTCKVDGRFHISDDDFLWDGARDVYETMVAYGHEAEWVTALCSGHCCAPGRSEAGDALQWFLGRTKCDGTAGSGCGDIRDLP